MKRACMIVVLMLAWMGTIAQARLSSDTYTLEPLNISSGGETSAGGSYTLMASTGQAGGVGVLISDAYGTHDGFWPPSIGQNPVIDASDPIAKSVARNSTCPGAENQVALAATDADSSSASLAWQIKTQPVSGAVSFVGGDTGPSVTVCYQPNPDYVGSDSFVLLVHDGSGGADEITVNVTVAENPVITAAVSSKVHGPAGTFTIDVFASGGVECRKDGSTEIEVTFNEGIQLVGPTPVVLSTGSVSSLTISGGSNEVLTIAMSGAADATPLTVAFPGVADASSASNLCTGSLCFGLLIGDVNADLTVNIFDMVQLRNELNKDVTGSNFRTDVNFDAAINIFDLVMLRNSLNKSVPACP